MGAGRTETCKALRHPDESRDVLFAYCYILFSFLYVPCILVLFYFLRTSSVEEGGGGGGLPDGFCFLFPVQLTTSGIVTVSRNFG